MTRGRDISEAELVLANVRAELRQALGWLTSSLTAHREVGLDQLRKIVAGLDAVLEGEQR